MSMSDIGPCDICMRMSAGRHAAPACTEGLLDDGEHAYVCDAHEFLVQEEPRDGRD